MESLLTSDLPLIREAWIWVWGWYKDAVECPPPQDRVDIANMMSERVELYCKVSSSGQPIPVVFHHLLVKFSIPEYEEIAWEVCKLCLSGSGVLSVMPEEHLRQWLQEVTWDNAPDATNI